jgi:hypothetical protein
MCGCGSAYWCAGNCLCRCKHDTLEGQREQAQHFALQYKDMQARATYAKSDAIDGAVTRARLWYAVIFGLDAMDNSVYDQFISTIRGDFHA